MFVVIAVIWNPVFPFPFTGPVWTAAQPVAARELLQRDRQRAAELEALRVGREIEQAVNDGDG